MADYIVHKAVEASKTRKDVKALVTQPGYLEENYYAQRKYDGCSMVAIVRTVFDTAAQDWCTSVRLLSRTGEEVRSLDHIKYAMLMHPQIADGVYFGEAWAHDMTFAEISGAFRRHDADETTCRLQFAIFDHVTLQEWEDGESFRPYYQRAEFLNGLFGNNAPQITPFWLAEGFGKIASTLPGNTVQDVCNRLAEVGGYDGLILRNPEGLWRKGDRGTGGEIIKVKRKMSFDLRVIGKEEGRGKHLGRLGAIIVEFNGKELYVGTGFTDKERSDWWCGTEPIGRIVEIEAMDYSADGLLREPRFKGIRYDKLEPDA